MVLTVLEDISNSWEKGKISNQNLSTKVWYILAQSMVPATCTKSHTPSPSKISVEIPNCKKPPMPENMVEGVANWAGPTPM